MQEPLISIIIPTYRVANFIAECLDSVLSQSYKNLEIIAVDDKSPDNTLSILREYEKKDSRLHVYALDKNHGTASVARNLALDHATGEYCTFVDSDDFLLDKEALEKLYKALVSSEADLATTTTVSFETIKGRFFYFDYGIELPKQTYLNQNYFPKMTLLQDITAVNASTFPSKLYKMAIIKTNQIKFPVEVSFEDNVFFWHYILSSQKGIIKISDPLYFYNYDNEYSISNTSEKYPTIFSAYKEIYSLFRKNGFLDLGKQQLDIAILGLFTFWQTGRLSAPIWSVNLSYFIKAKELFLSENISAPAYFSNEDKLGIFITKINASLGYFYYGILNDLYLMNLLEIWKKTYLIQSLFKVVKVINFTLLSFLKIFN